MEGSSGPRWTAAIALLLGSLIAAVLAWAPTIVSLIVAVALAIGWCIWLEP